MALTLQQLRVLVAVIDHRSFTRGAQAVFLTQSAASQHVRALEGALGTPLLERAGGDVLPTRAGEALLGYAREILRLAADAEERIGALRDGRAGRLVLGASGSAVYLAPALVAGFRAAHGQQPSTRVNARPEAEEAQRADPWAAGGASARGIRGPGGGIEVGLEVLPRTALLAALAQGSIDAALVAGPLDAYGSSAERGGRAAAAGARQDLLSHPLCPDRLVLAVSSTSPLLPAAALGPLPLERLTNETIVAAGTQADASPSWRAVERWAAAHGVELRPALRLDGVDAVKKTVEAGIGVAFLSAWVVERELALGTLRVVPLDPPAPRRSYELVRRRPRPDSPPDPALDALLRFAPDYLARHVPAIVGSDSLATPAAAPSSRPRAEMAIA